MIVREIKGSILDAPQLYIAHGVNCQNKMGAGVAKVLFNRWYQVKQNYHLLCENQIQQGVQPFEMLGWVQEVNCIDKIVFNCFTQEDYGSDSKLYLDYDAIRTCFADLAANPPARRYSYPTYWMWACWRRLGKGKTNHKRGNC